MKYRDFILLGVILLGGCTSLTGKPATVKANAQAAVEPNGSDVLLGALENARIPKGSCGMVLWTLDADRPIPVLRFIAGGQAEVAIDGALLTLTLSEASGGSGFGIYEDLKFRAEDDIVVAVAIRFGQGFDGGTYLQQGLITVEKQGGWKSVTPAAGIAGCRS